jgi:hypothetical protein
MGLLGREKVDRMVDDALLRMNKNVKGAYLAGLSDVVKGTPADTGVARNGWHLSVGAPSQSKTSSKNKQGSSSIRQIFKMPKMVLGKKIYYTNNTKYIGVLEYGGFPSPVEKGSYIKKSKSYEILSINGFSKQAPNGWVRATLIKMQNKIRALK